MARRSLREDRSRWTFGLLAFGAPGNVRRRVSGGAAGIAVADMLKGSKAPLALDPLPCRCNSHCLARIPAVRCGVMTACLPWRFRWEDRFFETPCSGHSSAQESIYTCRLWSSRKRRSSFKCKQCVPKVQKLHFELHFGRTRGTSSDCR